MPKIVAPGCWLHWTVVDLPPHVVSTMGGKGDQMIGNQELYTKWLRECPGADRFSIELTGPEPYRWRVSSWSSERFGEVILRGAAIGGNESQVRQELCSQLKGIIAAFENEKSKMG